MQVVHIKFTCNLSNELKQTAWCSQKQTRQDKNTESLYWLWFSVPQIWVTYKQSRDCKSIQIVCCDEFFDHRNAVWRRKGFWFRLEISGSLLSHHFTMLWVLLQLSSRMLKQYILCMYAQAYTQTLSHLPLPHRSLNSFFLMLPFWKNWNSRNLF